MQIVIDIPEKLIELAQRELIIGGDMPTIANAVSNGIVLSKGHGRLIDADELNEQKIPAIKKDSVIYVKLSTLQDLIDNAPTIIEAESEEK